MGRSVKPQHSTRNAPPTKSAGYTAQAVLENPGVRSLMVVDALAEVIEWHAQGLLPLGKQLTGDPRCRLVHGDFFAMAQSDAGRRVV